MSYIKELIEMSDDVLNVELENVKVKEFRAYLIRGLAEARATALDEAIGIAKQIDASIDAEREHIEHEAVTMKIVAAIEAAKDKSK